MFQTKLPSISPVVHITGKLPIEIEHKIWYISCLGYPIGKLVYIKTTHLTQC